VPDFDDDDALNDLLADVLAPERPAGKAVEVEVPAPEARPEPVAPAPPAESLEDEDFNLDDLGLGNLGALPETTAPAPRPRAAYEDDGDDPSTFMATAGIKQEKRVCYNKRPWMASHTFVLVKTIEELREVVDRAINETHRCSLDLETEGLDTRIYYGEGDVDTWEGFPDRTRLPATVHKIVGYCLSPDGQTGYYIPVRHRAEEGETPPGNIDPLLAAREIARLCWAAQPKLTEAGLANDPLASPSIEAPGPVRLSFWHAKFDQEMLYPVTGIDYWHPDSYDDGMLIYFVRYTNDKSLGLKEKAKELRTKQGHPYEMINLNELFINSAGKKREIDFPSLHPEEAYEYGASDSICTELLCKKPENMEIATGQHNDKSDFERKKKHAMSFMYRLEKQVAQVLRGMERPRIKIDKPYVLDLVEEAQKEAAEYEAEIRAVAATVGMAEVDLRSSGQLSDFLFTDKGLNLEPKPEQNEASGQYKTDADTLEALLTNNPQMNPILGKIVKFRQIDKVIGTYLHNMANNCDANDEIRYQFKQTGAATGRFSAPAGDPEHGYSGVPIHGIPATYDDKKPKVATALRKAIVARPGFVMAKIDFAGEELRIATNLSNEPVWLKEFSEGTGDLHTITARAFFGKQEVSKQERQMGKMANFSLLYGGGAQAIIRATGCNIVEAKRRKENFDKALPTFAKWVRNQKALCHKEKGVWTAFKRWIAVPEIDDPDKARVGGAERAAVNYPVQGTGADIMKIALVLLHKEFYRRRWLPEQDDIVRMLLTVHDEIVFEIRPSHLEEAMAVIIELMEKPGVMAGWKIPLVAEPLVGLSWDAKYDWHQLKHGKKKKDGQVPKDGEVEYDGRIFPKIPSWLEGYVTTDWMKAGVVPPSSAPAAPESPPPAPETPPAAPVAVAAPEPEPKPEAPPAVSVPTPPPSSPKPVAAPSSEVLTLRLSVRTRRSAEEVAGFVRHFSAPEGKVLRLLDVDGTPLVDVGDGIRVRGELFHYELYKHRLTPDRPY
jgi:DNA polymerase I-like protein with 3'-5' exonuclease and polymerase domains